MIIYAGLISVILVGQNLVDLLQAISRFNWVPGSIGYQVFLIESHMVPKKSGRTEMVQFLVLAVLVYAQPSNCDEYQQTLSKVLTEATWIKSSRWASTEW